MSNGFQEFGFGHNDTGIGTRAKKFKGEKGKSYRIGFAWWKGMEKEDFGPDAFNVEEGKEEDLTPKFIGAPRNYHKEAGYVINKGPEFTQLLGENPRMMIATLIIKWPLNSKGQLDQAALLEEMPEVMPWIFSQDKYEKLKKMHASGYWMHDHDVTIDCEDTQFQKFNFLPAKQNVFKEMLKSDKGKEVAKFVIERVRQMSPNLGREIGHDLSLEQLKEKLGVSTGGPVGNVVATDGEMDNMLSNMLDE